MLITVYCPSCRSRYQLDPGLRGQRIRCPNSVCREAFVVREESEPPTQDANSNNGPGPDDPLNSDPRTGESAYAVEPERSPRPAEAWQVKTKGSSRSGSISDFIPMLEAVPIRAEEPPEPAEPRVVPEPAEPLVPLLPAEPVEREEPPGATEAPSWHQPPPVRQPVSPQARSRPPELPAPEPSKTRARAPSPSRPPPVPSEPPPAPEPPAVDPARPPELSPDAWDAPPVRRPVAEEHAPAVDADGTVPSARRRAKWIIAALLFIAVSVVGTGAFYAWKVLVYNEERLYSDALDKYHKQLWGSATDAFDRLKEKYPTSERLPLYEFMADLSDLRTQVYAIQVDLPQASQRTNQFLERHLTNPLLTERRSDVRETLHKLAELYITLAEQNHSLTDLDTACVVHDKGQEIDSGSTASDLPTRIAQVKVAIELWTIRKDFIALLIDWIKNGPTAEVVNGLENKAWGLKLNKDPEVKNLLVKLNEAARQQVRYVDGNALPPLPVAEMREPSVRVAPLVGGPRSLPKESDRVFLALARGVLFGLSQSNGVVRWSTRVGIDTSRLPLRLPATPTSPEQFLVLTADRNTLMALDAATGKVSWQHQLSAPSLGRPVLVNNRVYVSTYDGRVHEIEIVGGSLLGTYVLGEPLSNGGAWQEGTDLLYFPADSQNLYVLDMAQTGPARPKTCVHILRTGHPSGSLRSEPIIVNRHDASGRDYLVLNQTEGLENMRLRVFALPIDSADAAPILNPDELRVRGWSWFQPYHDTEKIALVTDAGIFSLFGINQIRNDDKPLFPELRNEYELSGQTPRSGRAQVVHAQENDFWVLANGRLERLHFNRFRQEMVKLWRTPLSLGAPLHASQVEDGEQGQVLFLVTRSLSQPNCLATAVQAEDGTILWQRQLGLECQDDPLVLGQQVVALDRSGGLFAFDPEQHPRRSEPAWQAGGRLLARPLAEGPIPPQLLLDEEGAFAYEVACPGRGRELIVRRYQTESRELQPPTRWYLAAPLAGTPALGTDCLVLPLANGDLMRLPLDGKAGAPGVTWRAGRAAHDVEGHVVRLGADRFLATDGIRGLKRVRWSAPEDYKEEEIGQLPARIVAAPLVLPEPRSDTEVRVCVADAEGTVSLINGLNLKAAPIRQWRLGGKITAGPFLRGKRIGVVQRHQLVWLDPLRDAPLWQVAPSDEGIVGQPQLIGGLLVVADQAGRIVGLDPATGQPAGLPYLLRASAAPAATPVAFGPDRAFVPLTDGTVFLLSLHYLRHPLLTMPVVW